MSEKYIPVHIRLTETQYERLRREAFEKKVSQAEIVRLALEKYWEDEVKMKMGKFEVVRQFEDGDVVSDGKNHYLVVYGYSKGNEMGVHSPDDTDAAIYRWAGEQMSVEDLPSLKGLYHEWEYEGGFDIADSLEEDDYDWKDYERQLNEYFSDK